MPSANHSPHPMERTVVTQTDTIPTTTNTTEDILITVGIPKDTGDTKGMEDTVATPTKATEATLTKGTEHTKATDQAILAMAKDLPTTSLTGTITVDNSIAEDMASRSRSGNILMKIQATVMKIIKDSVLLGH